jgi:hypothetical protein
MVPEAGRDPIRLEHLWQRTRVQAQQRFPWQWRLVRVAALGSLLAGMGSANGDVGRQSVCEDAR